MSIQHSADGQMIWRTLASRPRLLLTRQAQVTEHAEVTGKRLFILGGTGYVGREVCKLAVEQGFEVTSLSRRGVNPEPHDQRLAKVQWIKGDATDQGTVKAWVERSDAVVHAIGLLFDIESGLPLLNRIVSGSRSVPSEWSTYDNTTRLTAFNVIEALLQKPRSPGYILTPVIFLSAAEAGWPEVSFGNQVERLAPLWLKRYLAAKRAVEAKLAQHSDVFRSVVYRPSLIWSWNKFDVLPAIPIFNLASALGVPFVDKTVQVSTLARAILAGICDNSVSGVQRFTQMEDLARRPF